MILSIHSSAFLDQTWPKTWPPFKFPPPAPLSAAATSLWEPSDSPSPGGVAVETASSIAATSSLYSTQLREEGKTSAEDENERFQMAFLDKRIALMRYDASHGSIAA